MMTWLVNEHQLDDQQQKCIAGYQCNTDLWIKGCLGSGIYTVFLYLSKKTIRCSPQKTIACVVPFIYSQSILIRELKTINFSIPVLLYDQIKGQNTSFDYLFCLFVEDFQIPELTLFRQRTTYLIVISSFYPIKSNLSLATDEAFINRITRNNHTKLFVTHHLPDRLIVSRLSEILEEKASFFSQMIDMSRHTTLIRLCESLSETEEVSYIRHYADRKFANSYSCAIFFVSYSDMVRFVGILLQDGNFDASQNIESLNNRLKTAGIQMRCYDENCTNDEPDCISLLLVSCSKVADFDAVFIPFMSSTLQLDEKQCAACLLLELQASQSDVYITYSVSAHSVCDQIRQYCHCIDIANYIPSIQHKDFIGF